MTTPDGCVLLPFQRGGVAYVLGALKRRKAALIGDDMGLGKTVQALAVVNETLAHHVLVVCPASVVINWQREAAKWVFVARVHVVSYGMLARLPPFQWDLAIFDEAQYLKSPDAVRTKAALAIPATHRLFLSGTPIVNRPIELQPLLASIAPDPFADRHGYGERYCNARLVRKPRGKKDSGKMTTEWDYSGASNLVELQRWLRSEIMVRRLKKDVLKDLPPKTRQLIELPHVLSVAESELLSALRKVWKSKHSIHNASTVGSLDDGENVVREKLSKVRHEQALAKAPAVTAHVKDCLENVDKVIVFAHHRDVIAKLEEGLKAYGVVTVQGGMSAQAKQHAVDGFQSDARVRVFIGQHEAAGTGLTLTAATLVVFAELAWTPGGMSQCEDRAWRIGQTLPVLVHYIVLANSLDARISKALIRKQRVLDQTLDNGLAEEAPFDWVAALVDEAP